MEITIKKRETTYCNLKLLLIFLVIFGHGIEPQIENSNCIKEIYRVIYMIHMPLFVFLSGLFLKNLELCLRQAKRSIGLYCAIQGILVVGNAVSLKGTFSFWKPYWHLWYLMSLSVWTLIVGLWQLIVKRYPKWNSLWIKSLVLLISLGVSCLSGAVPQINRMYSMSRTLVFFPYLWLGVFCQVNWKRIWWLGGLALTGGILLLVICGENIPTTFLYHASGYQTFHMSLMEGIQMRMLCYLIALCLGIGILCLLPDIHISFSKAGINTMPAYLIHGFVIRVLPLNEIPIVMLVPCVAAGTVYFLWMLYKILQWTSPLYCLVSHAAFTASYKKM
ncbi:MAG: acyltransferase family protein [Lachnospiraceae bacterium]